MHPIQLYPSLLQILGAGDGGRLKSAPESNGGRPLQAQQAIGEIPHRALQREFFIRVHAVYCLVLYMLRFL
jgi:hypothetical protein